MSAELAGEAILRDVIRVRHQRLPPKSGDRVCEPFAYKERLRSSNANFARSMSHFSYTSSARLLSMAAFLPEWEKYGSKSRVAPAGGKQ